MQTLISVFRDRAGARKAYDRLVQQGFTRDAVRVYEGSGAERAVADEEGVDELVDHTMHSAEREIAVDRGVLESLGHFFVSMFGQDRGEAAAGAYRDHVGRGNSVVTCDARDDTEAEAAAVTLHECGALEVEDRHAAGGAPLHPGVRMYERDAPTLVASAEQRELREESLLSQRAGQVSKELKADREERAYASPLTHTDRDRPK